MTLLSQSLTVYRRTKDMNLISSTILLYSYALSHPAFSFHKRNYRFGRFNGSRVTLVWERRCFPDVTLTQRCSGMPILYHLDRHFVSLTRPLHGKSINNSFFNSLFTCGEGRDDGHRGWIRYTRRTAADGLGYDRRRSGVTPIADGSDPLFKGEYQTPCSS
jgi:hypothetical protein